MAELAKLVAAMSRPEFYAHAVEPPIQVRQTHISYVFLTGDFAYKIKKPVNFGFLDFSTLEKRRHFCEEELRLNRVLAPALYVDVLPIYEREGSCSISASDGATVAEYALRMRQFREEDLWENVFDRGELGDARIVEMAELLAQLHAKARADEYVARFGAPRLVRKVAEDTFLQVHRNIGHLRNADYLRQAEAFAQRFLQEHGGLFQQRVDEKRIRECHGDLHLRNICFFEGAIQLFDRIEFNEEFRNIDVVYDLAFLVMDLADRGRRDLANLLWNTYVEESGDYEGALLMPFYVMMRALIRVKVLLLQCCEAETPEALRSRLREEAERYLALASRRANRRRGRVIVMCGLSGSGKSVVSMQIARRVDALRIRSDAVRKHLAGVGLRETRDGLYTPEMTERVYGRLTEIAIRLAREGTPVVLDATFGSAELRGRVRDTCEAAELRCTVVLCEADADTLRGRLAGRRGDVSDAGATLLEQQTSEFERPREEEGMDLICLDTTGGVNYARLAGSLSDL